MFFYSAVILLVIAQILVLVLAFQHFDQRFDKITSDHKDTMNLLSDMYAKNRETYREAVERREAIIDRLDFLVSVPEDSPDSPPKKKSKSEDAVV